MKLLIVGSVILDADPLVVTSDSVVSSTTVYPLVAIPGYQILDVSVPGNFALGRFSWDGSNVVEIPPVVDKVAQAAALQAQIDNLERTMIENRGSREFHMQEMLQFGPAQNYPTEADLIAHVPYYAKLKQQNDLISSLRAQIKALQS